MLQSKKIALAGLLALASLAAYAGAPEKTASGLIYESLKDGTGAQASRDASVQVHYRGTLSDGTEFDSSYKRGQPATFPLNRVIPCWTEGVGKMKEGGKAKLICPPEIAYGARGAGSAVPPNATLTFEVELLKVGR
jgi:FKBP-type peptidyl-prolyl cis-trans isomerase FkpA